MSEVARHYDRVARTLHWTIGTLIIANILLGLLHDPLGELFPAMPIHKSIGFLVLALSLVRLGWRIGHPVPPLPAAMPRWEKLSATALHGFFYVLMIAMPLTGWVFSSAGKYPIGFFGLFEIPKLAVDRSMPIVGASHEAHEILGIGWGVLLLVHIGAALRHHFILKDGVLTRMWRSAPGA